jgi:threonine synthase
MPVTLPQLDQSVLDGLDSLSLAEISYHVAHPFLSEDFTDRDIEEIISTSVNFPAPVVTLSDHLYVLELWHGPSLAFKDFGARFMAAVMSRLVRNDDIVLDILVATSGDTGGAVAAGFYGVPNIRVTILYPSGKVSYLQEKQLTTLGKNITALEVKGTFDDCQALVKEAFLDKGLNRKFHLSSANSINIARLIPQSFYYFEAYRQLPKSACANVVFCVPSGNFGNLTAGLIAKRMGLPIYKMIAATNINNVVPRYLESGKYLPKTSFSTISNAMDVGNPSNFQRMLDLYDHDDQKMNNDIIGFFFDDDRTRECMIETYEKYKYVSDPHGAVGFLACGKYHDQHPECCLINLETAHPAKFLDVMSDVDIPVLIPERLKRLEEKPKNALALGVEFIEFKDYLLSRRD